VYSHSSQGGPAIAGPPVFFDVQFVYRRVWYTGPVLKTPGTPQLAWVGDRHLRVDLGVDGGDAAHRRVCSARERIRSASIHALEDVTPAYATLLLTFDPTVLNAERAMREVGSAITASGFSQPGRSRRVEIPVCYEGDCAPDIEEVARRHNLTARDVATKHAAAEYEVCFIGFVPGFGYLGGLPSELATPRLESPRARVPVGSVGIAGNQTGVYPFATPGGWRLIGRTPLTMFDATRERASVLGIGDCVRFVAISRETFADMMKGRK
jgi:inhibitor of KinA